MLSNLFLCGVSPPRDEVPSAPLRTGLLFWQKDPKPCLPVRGPPENDQNVRQQGRRLFGARSVRVVREHGKGPRTPLTDVLIILFRVPPPPPRIRWLRNSLRSNSLRREVDSVLQLRRARRRGDTQETNQLLKLRTLQTQFSFLPQIHVA